MIARIAAVALATLVAGCGLSTNENCRLLMGFEGRMDVAKRSLDDTLSPLDRSYASLTNAENCIILSTRSYRNGSNDVRTVAQAAVENCSDAIVRVAVSQSEVDAPHGTTPRDVRTGLGQSYNAWAFAKYERMALHQAVISKAYDCKPPQ